MKKDTRRCICTVTALFIYMSIGGSSMVWKKIRMEKGQLEDYRARRNFTITAEPYGKNEVKAKGPIFVVQKHDARRLHYDFRIEIDGVLKSWAIPKGPSMDPSQKRLAVPTDDHPIEYAYFEGVIPEGEYGAGPVMIWDLGTYENVKREDGKLIPMKKSYKEGRIEINLDGEKLHGSFALIRTLRKKNDQPLWLLIKMKDEYASARRNLLARQPKSVLTGRTLKQIEKSVEKVRRT